MTQDSFSDILYKKSFKSKRKCTVVNIKLLVQTILAILMLIIFTKICMNIRSLVISLSWVYNLSRGISFLFLQFLYHNHSTQLFLASREFITLVSLFVLQLQKKETKFYLQRIDEMIKAIDRGNRQKYIFPF